MGSRHFLACGSHAFPCINVRRVPFREGVQAISVHASPDRLTLVPFASTAINLTKGPLMFSVETDALVLQLEEMGNFYAGKPEQAVVHYAAREIAHCNAVMALIEATGLTLTTTKAIQNYMTRMRERAAMTATRDANMEVGH